MEHHNIGNEIVARTRSRGEKILCGPRTASVDCCRGLRDDVS